MVALKGGAIEAFLARPGADKSVVLIYGPDTGLVSERARKLVKMVAPSDDPFSVVRLDAGDIQGQNERLSEEANTVSLFGDKRIVWLKSHGARNLPQALSPLMKYPPDNALVVVEAGDLKPSAAARKVVEKAAHAVAVPCYADTQADLSRLIDEECQAASLRIHPDARQFLLSQLGGDRLASRQELQKLTLYAHGTGEITLDDVQAISGDAAAFQMDELIDAVAEGDLALLVADLPRLYGAGISPHALSSALLRHFQTLHKLRSLMDRGTPAKAVVDGARPPIFFKRKARIMRQLSVWTGPRLFKALERINQAIVDTRFRADMAEDILSDVMLTLGRAARASR